MTENEHVENEHVENEQAQAEFNQELYEQFPANGMLNDYEKAKLAAWLWQYLNEAFVAGYEQAQNDAASYGEAQAQMRSLN